MLQGAAGGCLSADGTAAAAVVWPGRARGSSRGARSKLAAWAGAHGGPGGTPPGGGKRSVGLLHRRRLPPPCRPVGSGAELAAVLHPSVGGRRRRGSRGGRNLQAGACGGRPQPSGNWCARGGLRAPQPRVSGERWEPRNTGRGREYEYIFKGSIALTSNLEF